MLIAILGTGRVGQALATGLTRVGHEVVFGSRDPSSKDRLSDRVTDLKTAAAEGEMVINALPGRTALAILEDEIGVPPLRGKVLVDLANALDEELKLIYPDSSLGAMLQDAFPETRVIKTLNTVHAEIMPEPQALSGPSMVFLSGDDAGAKGAVSELLSDLGWSPESQLDLGGIATAMAVEHFIYLSFRLTGALGSTRYNIGIVD